MGQMIDDDGDQKPPGPDDPLHHHVRHHFSPARNKWISIPLAILHVLAVLGVAYFVEKWSYRTPALGERPPEVGRAVFGYGLFDEKGAAGPDLRICLCSFCCLPVQWADTLTKDKISFLGGNFWMALALSLLSLQELNHPTAGLAHPLFVLAAVYFRQKLREKFGLEHGTPVTLAADVITWCYCCFCAAAQEARQVEYFSTAGGLVPAGDYGFTPGGNPHVNIVEGTVVRSQAPRRDEAAEDARE